MSRRQACAVCGGSELAQILDLPALPLTGIYALPTEAGDYPNVDQALLLCGTCGHGQLRDTLDPVYLYRDTYSHRTTSSPVATSGNDFLFDFVRVVARGRRFRLALELGCNDLYLLRRLESMAERRVGIDPIWQGTSVAAAAPIAVIPQFIEQVDYQPMLGGRADLIVSAHTFEHLNDPRTELARLIEAAAPDALFVLEVPRFDNLLARSRFDQVFHQHIHYFSLASLRRLITETGGSYVAHRTNHGCWGGTLIVAFTKRQSPEPVVPPAVTLEQVQRSYAAFRRQLDELGEAVERLEGTRFYGYGAAQILPTLAYHMKSDLSFLDCIWDDDPAKDGRVYPQLRARIRQPRKELTLADSSVLVTALDSVRPILARLASLAPRHVLVPLHVF